MLALVVLLAFSLALVRSMRARRRAEALSGDKQALLEQSQEDATTDALTGMANRRKLFDDAERMLRALPDGGSLSLGIFDLDGFKNYNDTFGHPAGDSLLAHLGHQLAAAMRGRGDAYRMGGDEFCVVTRVAGRRRRARRCRSRADRARRALLDQLLVRRRADPARGASISSWRCSSPTGGCTATRS